MPSDPTLSRAATFAATIVPNLVSAIRSAPKPLAFTNSRMPAAAESAMASRGLSPLTRTTLFAVRRPALTSSSSSAKASAPSSFASSAPAAATSPARSGLSE